MSDLEQSTNGSGREEIQPMASSLLPFAVAAGLTVGVIGLISYWWLTALGVLIVLIAVVRWSRTVRREIAELPSETN